jgi:hypothetical protein
VGRGSVAGGTSDPSFPAPIVGFVPITGAYRAVKACSRASGCNHRVTAATRSEGPTDSSGDSGMALPGMTPTRSHQPITPFPAAVRHSGCDATNTNRPATTAATYAKYKTFIHRSRSHRSRLHHGGRYGSRIHRIGACPSSTDALSAGCLRPILKRARSSGHRSGERKRQDRYSKCLFRGSRDRPRTAYDQLPGFPEALTESSRAAT